jgi:hypothetical protein
MHGGNFATMHKPLERPSWYENIMARLFFRERQHGGLRETASPFVHFQKLGSVSLRTLPYEPIANRSW